jgi:pyridoxal phosphate enzyme (YggS family)
MISEKKAVVNLDKIITNIEFARIQVNAHHIVQLVGVSKYNTVEDINTLYQVGQRAFGENKIQDLKEKSMALEELPISWHFIGSLQKNKINNLIDLKPVLMHSLDSLDLAIELDKKLKAKNTSMNCLLQINSSHENTKSGVNPDNAVELYTKISQEYTNIKLKGVMSIGAHSEDKNKIKKSFEITKSIFDKCSGAKICSMGMSSDYELAIACGSNMIRVGSSLFDENTN